MKLVTRHLVVFIFLSQGVQCAEWANHDLDGTFKYACNNSSLTLPWKFILSPVETLEDIVWDFKGQSSQMIATSVHGSFFPAPAYSGRVQFVPNGGLSFVHVTVGDSGNYSVKLTILESDQNFQHLQQTMQLDVRDSLLTSDGRLHISENPVAVRDPGNDKWSLELQCGNFSLPNQRPPFTVDWLDPEGHLIPSASYEDDHFTLLLAQPVKGGNYTCRIPVRHYDDACLNDNDAQAAQATLFVDPIQTKIKLLETEKAALEAEVSALKSQGTSPTARVAFDAEMIPTISSDSGLRLYHDGDIFIFNSVTINQGGAYDNNTGVFVAPYDGSYHFTAVIASWALSERQLGTGAGGRSDDGAADPHNLGFCVHVDGHNDGRFRCIWSPLNAFVLTVHPRLTKGTRVWVEARSDDSTGSLYTARLSHFSGFFVEA